MFIEEEGPPKEIAVPLSPRSQRLQRTRDFQSEYQRENLENVTAEECKQDGQWTKWVIERCNEEQK
jgi:hypothetical protein